MMAQSTMRVVIKDPTNIHDDTVNRRLAAGLANEKTTATQRGDRGFH